MKIICATNMPYAQEAFQTLGTVEILPPRAITPERLRDADALAIRSTLRVTPELLKGSAVRFIGTATIGTDHMDLAYLDKAGIAWCAAEGCNANSVSEYVVTALLCVARRHGLTLEGKTMGIIGVGNVGRLVAEKARALGLRVLLNDPPRRDAEGGSAFTELNAVLEQADILTLHTPLTKSGTYPTLNLIGRSQFAMLKPGCLFVNAGRGPIMNSDALLAARQSGLVAHAVLDTWEKEPVFRTDILKLADIATPHIAGHSFEGKVFGTVMVYQKLCRFLGVAPTWTPDKMMPPPLVPELKLDAGGLADEEALWRIIRQVYDIEADDQRLRQGADLSDAERGELFEHLRQTYPVRREFRFTRLLLQNSSARLREKAGNLGFTVG